jgi:hypothetical protein
VYHQIESSDDCHIDLTIFAKDLDSETKIYIITHGLSAVSDYEIAFDASDTSRKIYMNEVMTLSEYASENTSFVLNQDHHTLEKMNIDGKEVSLLLVDYHDLLSESKIMDDVHA